MIFKNKLIKLPEGDNLTLFALSENEMFLYLSKDGIKKKVIKLGSIVRCESVPVGFSGDYLKQLSNDHFCLCIDGNMSIVDCDES